MYTIISLILLLLAFRIMFAGVRSGGRMVSGLLQLVVLGIVVYVLFKTATS